ncbi:MAG: hypothetical protein N2Z23_05530 [Pyrinomonadaceae bacterium]|nr:hypothetical protein [Pyrinomonadaceae bacterium]MCX7639886.1 hypothetical protein [Pyrinomonadaceae bacterium]MDW8304058.1 hypothetical protein [Acidobacteriota bacterium]
MQETKKLLPIISEDKKIQVEVEGEEVIIRFFTWAKGLGWQCQKTIRLNTDMLAELQNALIVASRKINYRQNNLEGKILKFPLGSE